MKILTNITVPLTDGIFETGAYGVPSKSQNPTVLGQDLVPNVQTLAGHDVGTNNYPPFQPTIKNQVFSLVLDILFFSKIRLEIFNI